MQEGQLSLNAMWGTKSNQTMMIKGSYRKRRLNVLINTGSTHNFLSEYMAKKLHYVVTKVKRVWVKIVNSQELKCDSMCHNLEWVMQ